MTRQAISSYKQELLDTARTLRQQIRAGEFTSTTSGLASGLMQGNIVILTADWAQDFLHFCQLNPVSCPLIAMSRPGEPLLPELGKDIDIRSDVPEYNLFVDGELTQTRTDIADLWNDQMVTFVLGCSFSFEEALQRAGLAIRNIDLGRNVSMYDSSLATTPSSRFHGNTVVTMRPFSPADAIRAIQVTTRLPKAHGAPVHIGRPDLIGIDDLATPQYGDSVPVHDDEIPVFWACGVTPQVAIRNAKPPICITHVPGKMLVTDKLNDELAIL
ncbi:putative hydro-lyase [Marinobacterium marinum]|uniref:Putative hydro-lyase H1S06_11685 n=1 Tax=Marinobacterium marinum TaxID=2756129 RepID=A0A7W1WZD2_9GAMM|nr:putative hydro-lyase [Marinobacterium marinum]MBA4503020.1 putative hydro-lyase [Marinobacterium marinum]